MLKSTNSGTALHLLRMKPFTLVNENKSQAYLGNVFWRNRFLRWHFLRMVLRHLLVRGKPWIWLSNPDHIQHHRLSKKTSGPRNHQLKIRKLWREFRPLWIWNHQTHRVLLISLALVSKSTRMKKLLPFKPELRQVAVRFNVLSGLVLRCWSICQHYRPNLESCC